ncbi:Uncharacterized protein OBRU01_23042, partial [Operophtera brumata]
AEHRDDREAHRLHRKRGRPVVCEDGQTDVSVRVDVSNVSTTLLNIVYFTFSLQLLSIETIERHTDCTESAGDQSSVRMDRQMSAEHRDDREAHRLHRERGRLVVCEDGQTDVSVRVEVSNVLSIETIERHTDCTESAGDQSSVRMDRQMSAEHRDDREAHRLHRERGRPVICEDGQTDVSVRVDVSNISSTLLNIVYFTFSLQLLSIETIERHTDCTESADDQSSVRMVRQMSAEHRDDREAHRLHRERGRPVVCEDGQTDVSVRVDVSNISSTLLNIVYFTFSLQLLSIETIERHTDCTESAGDQSSVRMDRQMCPFE